MPQFWIVHEQAGKKVWMPIEQARVGEDGSFTVKLEKVFPQGFLALAPDHKTGAYIEIRAEDAAQERTVVAKPLPEVKFKAALADGSADDTMMSTFDYVIKKDSGGHMKPVMAIVGSGEHKVWLPEGSYRLSHYGDEVVSKERYDLEVSAPATHLEAATLEPSELRKATGKPALPLTVTESRNFEGPFSLAALRGKWVLVDFWGYWCSPCVGEMPRLIDFYKRNAKLRDKFEIVAFHDDKAKTLAEMDKHIAKFEAGPWKGKIPFPLLMDATGETIKRYGITAFPTKVLIDPKGRIVPKGSLELLAEKIGAEKG